MIHPTQVDIGRRVIYRSRPQDAAQDGVITSFNDHYVFVRYGHGQQGIATRREDLEWLTV